MRKMTNKQEDDLKNEDKHLDMLIKDESWTNTIRTIGFDIWFNNYCIYLRDEVLRRLKEQKRIKIKKNGDIIWLK